jgi:hypothetical protein
VACCDVVKCAFCCCDIHEAQEIPLALAGHSLQGPTTQEHLTWRTARSSSQPSGVIRQQQCLLQLGLTWLQ